MRVVIPPETSRHFYIERRLYRLYFSIYGFIKLFFRNGTLATILCSFRLLLVKIIHPELHGTKDNIDALKNNMIMRTNFSDILFADMNMASCYLEVIRIRHIMQKLLETISFFFRVRQLIKIDPYIAVDRSRSQSKAMLKKLIVQFEILKPQPRLFLYGRKEKQRVFP